MSTSQARRAKRCFVIGPIGEENTATRNNADTLLAYVVKPALEPAYEVTRADDISKPGMVDAQVIIAIKLADLIVSDLHGENPNAYYELGIAHCFRKKTIHLIARVPRSRLIYRGTELFFTILRTRRLTAKPVRN